jgi:CRP-like cAMP-binding protein
MDPFEAAFPFLDDEQRRLLSDHSTARAFAAGDVILEEGAPASALHLVGSGSVAVEKAHLGGRIALAELGPGDLVGEVSFLDGSPTSASVVAHTEVTAYEFEGLEELLAAEPALAAGFYHSLAVTLAQRLRHGNEDRLVSVLQWG